ncbi:MAG TPA: hypothetical protein VE377_01550 [Candidatus Dormibacteraeota bacterium]|nr:hypothetical protein [Candidatus Dormibacteraeota bacterium]
MQTPIRRAQSWPAQIQPKPARQKASPEPTGEATARAQGKVGVLPENVAGAIAYLTFVPAIVLLFVEPYRRNRFVRFHCLQCLMFCFATIALAAALRLAGLVLVFIPVVGPLIDLLLDVVVALAVVLVWLVLLIKALQGEKLQLPLLGTIAEQRAERG